MKEFIKNHRVTAGAIAVVLFAHVFSFGHLAFVGWTMLLVTAAARTLPKYWIDHLVVERRFSLAKGRVGDAARGELTIRNTGFLPVPFLVARDYVDGRVTIEGAARALGVILPSRTMELNYRVTFPQRGYFQFGPACIETGDPFGLSKRYRSTGSVNHTLIYPKTLVLSRYDIASRRPVGQVRVTSRIFEDPLQISSVRGYEPGDPLRHIHWKATARTGTLQTKVFEPTTVIGATVILDFNRERWGDNPVGRARSELGVTLAASIAYHVYSKREKVGFLSNGADAAERMTFSVEETEAVQRGKALLAARPADAVETPVGMHIPTRRSEEQANLILEALARVELSDALPLVTLLAMYAPRLRRDASLVLITEHVRPPLAAMLQNLRHGGFAVRVLCVSEPISYRSSFAALAAVGIDCQLIRDEEDMNEIAIHGI